MTDLSRRGALGLFAAALAAPAIIRTPGLLMPVRPPLQPVWSYETWKVDPVTRMARMTTDIWVCARRYPDPMPMLRAMEPAFMVVPTRMLVRDWPKDGGTSLMFNGGGRIAPLTELVERRGACLLTPGA